MPKPYTRVPHSIPEEDGLRFSSDDSNDYRLHNNNTNTNAVASSSRSPNKYHDSTDSIADSLDRNRKSVDSAADFEAYLDTLTEDEQQLLSASAAKDYEYNYGNSPGYELDDLDVHGDRAGTAAARRRAIETKQRKKYGWRGVYRSYSRTWWTTLVVVVAVLGAMVWGFLVYAGGEGAWEEYDMPGPDSYFPTPKGGTLQQWAESYAKAAKMVEKMTLIEKVNVTTGTGWMMGMCVGNTETDLTMSAPAENVGFPPLCLQDGPLGIRYADHISAFPAGITTGATWNRDLIYQRGVALGREARLKGVNVLLGPSMGSLGMMPAGGRNWEGFGSDPVLQGIAAAHTIQGIQSTGVIATAKHLILNEQEHFRQPHEWGIPVALSSNIGDRALHEVFLWPFAESVRAGVGSVMCAYNQVNNSYACENSMLLNGLLKDELGFQGFVQSDWLAQRSGVGSALSGLDMSMPGDGLSWMDGVSLWGSELTRAALNASVPMERLNDMVTRIVAAWYQLGQDSWERPPPEGEGGPNFSSWTDEEFGLRFPGSPGDESAARVNRFVDAQGSGEDAHSIVARKVAAEGVVLVKNVDGVLPLSREPKADIDTERPYRVGVYGDDAGPGEGPNACENRGCNQGTLAMGWGSGAVEFPYLISPIDALQTAWKGEVEMTPYMRNAVMPADTSDKDLCLVFANADSGEGFISAGGIHGDRNNLFLQKGGDTLVHTVATNCGGPTVVIVHAVGPVVVDPWIDLPGVKSVLLAHLPGQESGNALLDVLFGDVDASGRLPYTVGKSAEDYGPGAQVLYESNAPVPQVDFSDSLYIDHRYFDKHNITPRYEFGFGLSYTTWQLSNLEITSLQKNPSRLPAARSKDAVSPPTYDPSPPPANESVLFPAGFRILSKYIYPYLSNLDGTTPPPVEPGNGSTKQRKTKPSDAGGGAGGNPSLYEPLVQIDLDIVNSGSRAGQQVVQLYVSFPDPERGTTPTTTTAPTANPNPNTNTNTSIAIDFPDRVLRNFTKVSLEPAETGKISLSVSRKDLSYWDVEEQNWVLPSGEYVFSVGFSSRDLPLQRVFEV
ncbi:putative beta-glucosidase E [Aspergillus crustosus]